MVSLSNAALEGGSTDRPGRVPAVDVARGVAVAAMVFYHFAWDLSELRLIETEVTQEPGWRLFARVIAASFLLLAGIGLALGHPDAIRWRPFLRRLGTVAGAALLITAATAVAYPQSYIFFGILHAIALSSLLAVPLTQAPAWVAALAAGLAWAAPAVLTGLAVFEIPALAFLGLAGHPPVTNDWVPLLPWSGFAFAGVAAGKAGRRLLAGRSRPLPPGPAGALAWAGRHSLVIYLLHQPVLLGLLAGLVQATGPNPAAVAAPFARSCAASCSETGQPETVCRATCACTVAEIRRAPLWRSVLGNRVSPEESAEIGRIAQGCFARSRQPG